MSTPDPLLVAFAAHTEPNAQDLERVAWRLRLERDPAASAALLGQLPEPSASSHARVLARVRASTSKSKARPALGWSPARLAGAGALLLVVGLAGALGPRPDAPRGPDLAIAETLEAVQPSRLDAAPGVRLTYTGWGYVTGTERRPRIHWAAGDLRVEVEPGQGIDLIVETPNGSVQVVGTIFEVHVDDPGTRVRVDRGKVEVTCVLGATTPLRAGEETICVRASAANLLTFAIEARQRDSDLERVLSLVDQGLELDPDEGAVHDELLLVRFQSLMSMRRPAEARLAADAYLQSPAGPRQVDVLRAAAKLAFVDGACATALPYLERLESSGGAAAEDLLPLASCLAAVDPDRTRAIIGTASALSPSPEVAVALGRLRDRLPPTDLPR